MYLWGWMKMGGFYKKLGCLGEDTKNGVLWVSGGRKGGYWMSGAAARTGGLKEIGEKERYI